MSKDNNKSEQKSEENRDSGRPPAERETNDQSSLPLYLRNKSEGNRDNAQDEKDESAE